MCIGCIGSLPRTHNGNVEGGQRKLINSLFLFMIMTRKSDAGKVRWGSFVTTIGLLRQTRSPCCRAVVIARCLLLLPAGVAGRTGPRGRRGPAARSTRPAGRPRSPVRVERRADVLRTKRNAASVWALTREYRSVIMREKRPWHPEGPGLGYRTSAMHICIPRPCSSHALCRIRIEYTSTLNTRQSCLPPAIGRLGESLYPTYRNCIPTSLTNERTQTCPGVRHDHPGAFLVGPSDPGPILYV